MTHYQIAVEIQAPPPRVWAVLLDVERWPEWTSSISELRRLQPGPLQVGSRVYIRQPKLRPNEWTITALDHDVRSFTWAMASFGLRVTATHAVHVAPAGARAVLTLDYAGPLAWLVGLFGRSITERYINLEANGLRRRSQCPAPLQDS